MLFLDTSALIFLYINSSQVLQSNETTEVRAAVAEQMYVAASTLALPEAAAAFGRLAIEKRIAADEAGQAYSRLLEDWNTVAEVPLDRQIALEAGALARSQKLRGADAVHLASAALLARQTRGVRFLSFDQQLNQAARTVVKLWGE